MLILYTSEISDEQLLYLSLFTLLKKTLVMSIFSGDTKLTPQPFLPTTQVDFWMPSCQQYKSSLKVLSLEATQKSRKKVSFNGQI